MSPQEPSGALRSVHESSCAPPYIPPCAPPYIPSRALMEHPHGALSILLAGRSGVRSSTKRIADGALVPTVAGLAAADARDANETPARGEPGASYGGHASPQMASSPQMGVVSFDLTKMRRWASSFCPRAPWWHCVVRQLESSRARPHNQAVVPTLTRTPPRTGSCWPADAVSPFH